MTRLEALRDLAEKVEAGEAYETMGHTILCQKAFPKPENFDYTREAYSKSDAQMAILVWKNGSLDTAKALHDAVLPGWGAAVGFDYYTGLTRSLARVSYMEKTFRAKIDAIGAQPARVWLLCIIKVLIALEEDK